jgi:hypothetical protein
MGSPSSAHTPGAAQCKSPNRRGDRRGLDSSDRVPTRRLVATRRFRLGAVPVYRLVLLHRLARGADLRVGLEPGLRAAAAHLCPGLA